MSKIGCQFLKSDIFILNETMVSRIKHKYFNQTLVSRIGHQYAKLDLSALNGCKWLKPATSLKSDTCTCTLMLGQTSSICKEWHLTSAKYNYIKQLWRTYFDGISLVKSNSSQTVINLVPLPSRDPLLTEIRI